MIIKKKFPLFFLLFIMSSAITCAQNSINFSLHQDFKLLVFGDQLGNRAGTLDLIARVKYEAKDRPLGFVIYGLEYEKALLADPYTRLGSFAGFTFMDIFNDYNFHATSSLGAGFINRKEHTLFSWSASIQLDYFITSSLKISVLNQLTERTDLKVLYGDLKYRYSLFVGLEIRLFGLNKN
ncbi:hypothetical protein [Polaribacter sp. IC073]|uniref:hypothetical protein n=1 Tax=Polaribacter sp. IC073 TaxID=2508540 RepID=UPI0011C29A89|nr:hypothetical protein [Polaribacter sp. IC073]TXD49378.1 hypothetical protein ES045_04750 [Polaribacter sp. IC073]